MKEFVNKVAVVTGAGNGIGKAIAKKCLTLGMKVVAADINEELLTKFKNELSNSNNEILTVVTDVSNKESINHLAHLTIEKFGQVNLLFNNAGIMGPVGPIWEVDSEAVAKVVNVNLMSTIYGLQAFLPIMIEQKEECHIVNTASAAGLGGIPNLSAYTATKHAIVGLTEMVFSDLKQLNKNNINMSVLCPGTVNTEFANQAQANNALASQVISRYKATLKQAMSPEEVAEKTFTAISNDQFYIFTHPELNIFLKKRFENIFNETLPNAVSQEKLVSSNKSEVTNTKQSPEKTQLKLFDQKPEVPGPNAPVASLRPKFI